MLKQQAANLFDSFILAKLLSNADEIIGSKIPVLVPLDHTIEKRWVGVGVGMAEWWEGVGPVGGEETRKKEKRG